MMMHAICALCYLKRKEYSLSSSSSFSVGKMISTGKWDNDDIHGDDGVDVHGDDHGHDGDDGDDNENYDDNDDNYDYYDDYD